MKAIVMAEAFWRNSQLSIAGFTGSIRFNGHEFVIVNKEGIDVFELSAKAKPGQEKIIAPGEPADLCRRDFVPIYRKLGREKFLRFLEENPDIETPKAARERLKTWVKS